MARTEKATDPQAHPLQYWFWAHPPRCQRPTRGPGEHPRGLFPKPESKPEKKGIRTLFPVHLGGRIPLPEDRSRPTPSVDLIPLLGEEGGKWVFVFESIVIFLSFKEGRRL